MTQADIIIENAQRPDHGPREAARRGGRSGGRPNPCRRQPRDDLPGLRRRHARIDAGGCSVLPGFIDSHIHLFAGGAQLKSLSLAGVTGFDAIAAAVRKRASGRAGPAYPGRRAGCLFHVRRERADHPPLARPHPAGPAAGACSRATTIRCGRTPRR